MQDIQEPFILVAQSFGRESEYRRVAFAILSYYAYNDGVAVPQTILFTDQPSWFEPYFKELPISFVLLSPEKIKQMRGKIDFLHRMKIALIEEAFQTYNTNILYLDSDTFFVTNPSALMSQLSPQNSFMHLWEYQFESLRKWPLPAGATFQAFMKLIESKVFRVDNAEMKIEATMSSWNAGVMMLHQSHQVLIPAVYQLTEQFYPDTQNHASEQYAFSIMLQTKTKLQACDTVIYHYWYGVKKKIMDELLEKEFKQILLLHTTAQRLRYIKELIKRLPLILENHQFALKDNAVQTLNNNQFSEGFKWAFKAIFAGAFKDGLFIKDVLYHFKRLLTNIK
ncbi:MAG: hypothetical protein QM530_06450 [Phycisphaerales bacterium]|nr:hypothetical protein [Phycisphaerales bacterium]